MTTKNYNLPWHTHDHYWISLYARGAGFPPAIAKTLQKHGLQKQPDGSLALRTQRQWKPVWDKLYQELTQMEALDVVEAIITPGADAPQEKIMPDGKSSHNPQDIAASLWIGDALLDDRIICYLQPVLSGNDKIFGYESFARVKGVDGKIIGGEQIVSASKILGIEHMIDRHLHVQAIKTFAASDFNGFLFVNFFPGFIHRPAVYLEGLNETAKQYGIISKHIVLDLTKAETPRDSMHLKSVCDYGRSCGYSVALDDIASVDVARRLIQEIRPDFVKIDMHLVHQALDASKRETIRTIVDLVHAAGGTAIAEGVETADIFEVLKSLGVDLFQGYLFSPPVPVEAVLKRMGSTAS